MPSVYIKTYGCQMNERDSEAVAAQLVAKGYALAPSEATADVILLNTCSVRDLAEQKALRKMENVAAEMRRSRPGVVLGFMGCMAQSRGRELIDRLPDVDLVVGTQKFHRVGEYLDQLLGGADGLVRARSGGRGRPLSSGGRGRPPSEREKIVDVEEEPGSQATIREHLLNGNGRKAVTAFVSIMQGCNQYCTFCIVPYTRGEERSRTIADIVAECRELVTRGVKEVTLLGQIVTSFGRRDIPKQDGKTPFVQLLEAVHEIEGLERIRFTSPHPKGYGDDLIEAYGRLPKLVESAHVPVQSGSDRILKLMHRGYTRERFMEIVSKLRLVKPGIGVSTDFIVGFPGETEADFELTLSLVREAAFDQAFVFKYSERRDTPAASMPDQVPQIVREERNQRLLSTVNEVAASRYQPMVGREVEILVEGPSKKNPARYTGRTRCNKIVVFDGSERHRRQVMNVRVTRTGAFTLYGDPGIHLD
ncbi:MAG: tRNA (N6-isopentenyl adenosine(37)-C2)-methylthiotransferase MiaB [Verrucomicrobia bacterium]|nr:MAG: tRNA (N6-isopentenyl adenosine(37)-C2)-methylthiotransferase MiaB [Verrucomicrobiota bacterium]